MTFGNGEFPGEFREGMFVEVAVVYQAQGLADHGGAADVAGVVVHVHVGTAPEARTESVFQSGEDGVEIDDVFFLCRGCRAGRAAENSGGLHAEKEFSVEVLVFCPSCPAVFRTHLRGPCWGNVHEVLVPDSLSCFWRFSVDASKWRREVDARRESPRVYVSLSTPRRRGPRPGRRSPCHYICLRRSA